MEPPKQPTPAEPEAATSLEKVVLDKGWAKPEQIAAAAQYVTDRRAQGEIVSLSQALVTLGTLTSTQVREALGSQEKTSMRCPTCRKVFNVWGKAGPRTLCRTCKVPLIPTGASYPIPSSPPVAPSP